jgi:aminobenzoyl-glutamate utilization protein B
MDIGWNFRREHLRLQQRSHYVIPNGGDQPTSSTPNASVWYYPDGYDEVEAVGHQHTMARPMMTDRNTACACWVSVAGAHEQDGGRDDVREHRKGRPAAVGEADQALAKAVQREMKVPETGLATKINPLQGRDRS